MPLSATVRVAFRSIRSNKLRSALTMLGIVIGVGSVIAMLAVGGGASRMINSQLESIGTNLLIVFPGSSRSGGVRFGAGTAGRLTLGDARAIGREAPAVEEVAPIRSGSGQIIYGNRNWNTRIEGTTTGIFSVRDWSLERGRRFSPQEVRSASKVALLGTTVARELFGGLDPLGEMIRINRVPFRVIGLLEEKGQTPTGRDQDDTVYVPLSTAQKRLFPGGAPGMIDFMLVKARGPHLLGEAEEQVSAILRQRHRIGRGEEPDFRIRNLTQMLSAMEETTNIMSLLLGAIASVSMIVGGIGIMNIMLVSVTERTREIGIRMAVGARPSDIRLQFMVEALALSVMGGTVGLLLGWAGSDAIGRFAGWPILVSPWAVLLALAFSAFVGVFFGLWPAWKASSLDPISALRHE